MTRLDRRRLIHAAAAFAALPALARAAAAPPVSARYAVLRNGKPFGQYNLTVASAGDVMTVTTDVAMSARIAGVTVFDYRHHCEETWKAGRFMAMRSHSVRDNQPDMRDAVTAVRVPEGLRVTNKSGLVLLSSDAHPLTHWNPDVLSGPLFNPQTGFSLNVTVTPLGRDAVVLASGAKVAANHWSLRGEAQLDDWYDDAGQWLGLRGVLPDRSLLEYRRV